MKQQYVKLLTTKGYSYFAGQECNTFPATRVDCGWIVDGLFFGEEDVEEVFLPSDKDRLILQVLIDNE